MNDACKCNEFGDDEKFGGEEVEASPEMFGKELFEQRTGKIPKGVVQARRQEGYFTIAFYCGACFARSKELV